MTAKRNEMYLTLREKLHLPRMMAYKLTIILVKR